MAEASPEAIELVLPRVEIPDARVRSTHGALITPGQRLGEKRVVVNSATVSEMLQRARQAASKAHAPYSGFHVGAAAIMADDPEQKVLTGSNVENSSYGATICGERSVLTQAAGLGFRQLRYLALSTVDSLNDTLANRSPCGMCRQMIREFVSLDGSEDALIFIDTAKEGALCEVFDVERLLPWGFNFAPPSKTK